MKIQILLVSLIMTLFTFNASAVQTATVSNDNLALVSTVKKDGGIFSKATTWVKKKFNQVKTFIKAIDFNDPATVLKYCIIAILAALVIGVLGLFVAPLWYLSYILWLVGIVLFWYWVYLKFLA